MESNEAELSIDRLSLSFGGLMVLSDVSLQVRSGGIVAIIGPNGAGKTSLLNCVNGFYRPDRGTITFQGQDITRLSAHKVAGLGIARTFQNIALYSGMNVVDNLMAARHIHMESGIVAGAIYFGRAQGEEVQHRRLVEEIIEFLEIEHIRKATVGALPYGLRKRVELGRALALEPKLLLLDEPMTGMNVEEKEDVARFVLDIHELQGTTVVLIEHDMGLVMDISERIIVLDFGCKIAEGTPDEIKRDEAVIQAYLGQDD
jgi:branched-chain amino acid transport system ATP-binding protein